MEKYKNSFKIGVCYSIQEHDSLPSLEHDVKLDALITELEIIVFPHAKN
jgi:5-formyltetrahydrofolate cyclo-ligase